MLHSLLKRNQTVHALTWLSGTRGGPIAISAAFVPGLIRRAAPSSGFEVASRDSSFDMSPMPGLCGPNWTSGMGGGEGSLGELDGDTPDLAGLTAAMMYLGQGPSRRRGR